MSRRNYTRSKAKRYTSQTNEHIVRGTAKQVAERYETLAREANAKDDKLNEQVFLQQAEHYRKVED